MVFGAEIYKTLSTPKAIMCSTFIWGMSQVVKIDAKTADNPLTCLFYGTIEGVFYTFCGMLISELMPPDLRGLVSVACIAGTLIQKTKEMVALFTPQMAQSTNTEQK